MDRLGYHDLPWNSHSLCHLIQRCSVHLGVHHKSSLYSDRSPSQPFGHQQVEPRLGHCVFLSHLMVPSQRPDPQTPTSYNRLVIIQSQGDNHLFRLPVGPWLFSLQALSATIIIPWLVRMHEMKSPPRQCLLPCFL